MKQVQEHKVFVGNVSEYPDGTKIGKSKVKEGRHEPLKSVKLKTVSRLQIFFSFFFLNQSLDQSISCSAAPA